MMSTRITGLNARLGVRRRLGAVKSWSMRRRLAIGGAVMLLGVLAACSSTSTYPVDIFTAMHYNESWRTNEPPRFLSPDTLVPVEGVSPAYSNEELGDLGNPIVADEQSVEIGRAIYNTNCVVCHGPEGQGNGPIAAQFETYGARLPADLTAERLQQVPDSYLYTVVVNGLPPYMPAFGNLIPGEEIWHLVNYVRELQGQ